MKNVEDVRARYRPERIKTLFVGESAPYSGAFFYCGNNAMLSHMRSVLAPGESDGDFLESFKARAWFLDDLSLEPANHLPRSQKRDALRASVPGLAERIALYRPEAIVSVLFSVAPFVEAAADQAGSAAPRFRLPFPGMGHQLRFKTELERILPDLPRLAA